MQHSSDKRSSLNDPSIKKRQCPIWGSLSSRLAISAILIVALSATSMLYSLDYFLTRDFHAIHASELKQQSTRIESYIDRQVQELSKYARLATHNRTLRNTLLELDHIQVSRQRIQSFVTRTASLYNLDSVTVWNNDGGLVAANENIIGNMALHLSNFPMETPRSIRSGLVNLGRQLWVISTAPINIGSDTMFVLQFSRLLDDRIAADDLLGVGLKIEPKETRDDTNPEAALLKVHTVDGSPLQVSISSKNTVVPPGLHSKVYVASAIAVSSLLLFLIFLFISHRESKPFKRLQIALRQVGQGDFSQSIEIKGCNEAVELAESFNHMVIDLSRLRSLERSLDQERRLAAAGRLATRVAHDINNPISVIRSVADISRRRYGNDNPFGADMDTIYQQSSRCLQIAENLVAFSKPRNIERNVIELNKNCEEYLIRRKQHAPDFKYQFTASPKALLATGNKYYLWQVLDNLTDNALQSNNNNTVFYTCHEEAEYTIISIRDNGIGFPSGQEEDIFELFFSTRPDGSGMGLPNALSITHALGGTIRITNPELGEISIYLPTAIHKYDDQFAALPAPY